MEENGLYNIDAQYFTDFANPYWLDHKQEKRPYYYALKDSDGVFWMIPLSSQAENYKTKLSKLEEKYGKGNCVFYFIGSVLGKEQAFLISDMFPISEDYIKKPFVVAGTHVVIRNSDVVFRVRTKALTYLKLVQSGKLHSRNDILSIKRIILNKKANKPYLL